jgi:hypothetical protein
MWGGAARCEIAKTDAAQSRRRDRGSAAALADPQAGRHLPEYRGVRAKVLERALTIDHDDADGRRYGERSGRRSEAPPRLRNLFRPELRRSCCPFRIQPAAVAVRADRRFYTDVPDDRPAEAAGLRVVVIRLSCSKVVEQAGTLGSRPVSTPKAHQITGPPGAGNIIRSKFDFSHLWFIRGCELRRRHKT